MLRIRISHSNTDKWVISGFDAGQENEPCTDSNTLLHKLLGVDNGVGGEDDYREANEHDSLKREETANQLKENQERQEIVKEKMKKVAEERLTKKNPLNYQPKKEEKQEEKQEEKEEDDSMDLGDLPKEDKSFFKDFLKNNQISMSIGFKAVRDKLNNYLTRNHMPIVDARHYRNKPQEWIREFNLRVQFPTIAFKPSTPSGEQSSKIFHANPTQGRNFYGVSPSTPLDDIRATKPSRNLKPLGSMV